MSASSIISWHISSFLNEMVIPLPVFYMFTLTCAYGLWEGKGSHFQVL